VNTLEAVAKKTKTLDALVWCVGLEAKASDNLSAVLKQAQCLPLPYDLEKLCEDDGKPPAIILCGPPDSPAISTSEVAQTLRMLHPEVPIYFISFSRGGYDRGAFKKNGFTDAFLFPVDIDLARNEISTYFTKISNGEIKTYRPVKLLDIESGTKLQFDTTIYLPANNKYIRYSAAGQPLSEERIKKLSTANMNSVYVSSDQMSEFYKYTATQLKNVGKNSALSETEKRAKMESAIRELTSGMFNDNFKEATFEEGKALLNDLREITVSYIDGTASGDWYKRLAKNVGAMASSYSHSANVSTYAALFSIGLGIGDPAEIATAGLLHDIGLADIPFEIVDKPEELRTPEERKIYETHPERAIDIIKRKKLALSEKVMKMIMQHHEKFNGEGYPNGLIGSRTLKESQILALADKFDYLTSVQKGRLLMSPAEAIQYFRDQIRADPGQMTFDPAILTGLFKLFPANEGKNGRT
jgi:HD-GYP domain-containing protein (c-di-GMP phosphodiesterase class II)